MTTDSTITCGNGQVAGKGKTNKLVNDVNQPGISEYISPKPSKRGPSSPIENHHPTKKMNLLESTSSKKPVIEDPHKLPPEFKLLYDCISARLDTIDKRLDKAAPEHVETLEIRQQRTDGRLTRVERENQDPQQCLTNIEDKMLETSLVFSGFPEEKWEEEEPRRLKLTKEIANTFHGETEDEKLKKAKEVQIVSTERLGRYNPQKGRPITVKFSLKMDAEHVLESKKKLTKGIYVEQHYSEATEAERKRLRPILMAARKLEEYRGKCKLEGTSLKIKGKYYNWDNLHELPQNISPHNISSRQDAAHYGFFSELNPLSNFHPAPFQHEGCEYINSEQLIQAKKAEFSGDHETLKQIMCAKTAKECKELGREVKNCNTTEWNQSAKELCFPGLLAKFRQNKVLAAFLKNTGNKTLLECCYDKVWGNGYPLSDPQCIDPNTYDNQGILGEMLEEIRAILRITPENASHTLHVQTTSHVETSVGYVPCRNAANTDQSVH